MRAPAVSVLVPVYNGEPFLAECLDSILAQDFGDFELLIGDDGSTDGSVAIIERYAGRDRRIRWWRNPRNLGIGGNWNGCLHAAQGRFIKYVLHDDKLLDNSVLRRMTGLLEADPSVSLAASAAQLIDARSQPTRTRFCFRESGVWEGKRMIVHCFEQNANVIGEPSLTMFPRAQAARGFQTQLKQLLDLEMWFHLLEQGSFAYLAEPLCAFRQHPAQQTEVNWHSGACANEGLLLAEEYCARPWMKEAATPQMLFSQMYYLRKHYGGKSAPLVAELGKALNGRAYAACWLRHRLTKPFRNMRYWLEKRRVVR
jgi:glycosyltransferase involved in cell wall biosynthesis